MTRLFICTQFWNKPARTIMGLILWSIGFHKRHCDVVKWLFMERLHNDSPLTFEWSKWRHETKANILKTWDKEKYFKFRDNVKYKLYNRYNIHYFINEHFFYSLVLFSIQFHYILDTVVLAKNNQSAFDSYYQPHPYNPRNKKNITTKGHNLKCYEKKTCIRWIKMF